MDKYLNWEFISQVGIFVFGASAIVLVARKNRWGFVMGLLSQPFWFISSFQAKQWGVFIISFIYAFSWIYGIYEWFLKDSAIKPEK